MTKEDAIERVCQLVNDVWRKIDPEYTTASDCFCRRSRMPDVYYRNELHAIEWVERVVREALAKEGGK